MPIETQDVTLERRLVAGMLVGQQTVNEIMTMWDFKHGRQWFTAGDLRWIAFNVIKRYRSDGCIPSKDMLMSVLHEETAESDKSPEEREKIHENYDILIDRLFQTEPLPKDEGLAIAKRLVALYRNREIVDIGGTFADLVIKGEVTDGLKELRSSLLKIEELDNAEGIVIGDLFDYEEDLQWIEYKRLHPEDFIGIPTGIPEFDQETQGIHWGETGIIAAPSGRGKTTLAVDIGATALTHGYNVCQFTIESSLQLIKFKYYARLCQLPYNLFKFAALPDEGCPDWVQSWVESMEQSRADLGARLKIVDIPEGATPNVIESIIVNRFGDWRPDMVIIDHQGLVSPDNMAHGRSSLSWDSQGAITAALMGKARKLTNSRGGRGIGMWILVQNHVSAAKKKIEEVSNADIGLSYLIAQPAHYVIHIIRNEEHANNEEAYLKISKVRDGKDNLIAYVHTDFARSTFIRRQIADTTSTTPNIVF